MPRTNRVRPDGRIVADPARGDFFGNRGVLHDDEGRLVREFQVRRWLVCRLHFRGRRRPLAAPGRYTALFFLDEPTALAAGHRPCAECRNGAYRAFRAAFPGPDGVGPDGVGPDGVGPDSVGPDGVGPDGVGPDGGGALPSADAIDRVLHAERRGPRVTRDGVAGLPDGVLVADGDGWWLLHSGQLHPWRPGGYGPPEPASRAGPVTVLTPPSTVAALARGYTPVLHAGRTGTPTLEP